MIAIRLTRSGSPKKPFYRIVAIDSHKKKNGISIETLGFYRPHKNLVSLEKERLLFWQQKGAKVSPAVAKLLN